jgi:tripartite-type tricarboxylate transporter receptor subunit TctC
MGVSLRRRRFLRLSAAALVWATSAAADDTYPSRPLRLVVPFAPGGAADTIARLLGQSIAERLGQPVVIENKPGGGTNVATQQVAAAPPDGHTLLWLGSSAPINAAYQPSPSLDLLRDLAPVCGVVDFPFGLVASPALPAKDLAGFIAFAKRSPGQLNFGSWGTGTVSHVAGELLKAMAGIDITHVPYRGGAPMIVDLLSGRIQAAFDVMTTSLPHIREGRLTALGIAGAARFAGLPDVPAIGELVPDYEASVWTGLAVPAGTPAHIIDRLNREVNGALSTDDVKARLSNLAASPILFTPAEFGAHIAAEIQKWSGLVRRSGAKP